MFPWIGEIEIVRNTDVYSLTDVKTILNEARKLNLDVIPLVQTFGHLEWLLKFEEFRKFRENDTYPQVLCLGDEDAVAIVKEALKQVIDVHKEYGIPFFHIGADEAFEVLLNIILLKLADFYPIKFRILVWHDMLKDFDGLIIKKLGLGELVEPVVWDYSENIVTMNGESR
uniref:beta-N-acetylhexosaminidase n=1 Tax=Heterorhabditis bacteriophora TaxID=37862 RepID=A0A1I7X3E5_HETBA